MKTSLSQDPHMSHTLDSLKGGDVGDYIGFWGLNSLKGIISGTTMGVIEGILGA